VTRVMAKKAKANKQFPSLPYYPIKRAAKTLGCKVTDIIQRGIEGDITLMVNFDQWAEPVYGCVEDYSKQPPDDDGTVTLSDGRACYGEIEPTGDEKVVSARLGGIWCVYWPDLYECYVGRPLENPRIFARTDILAKSSTIDALACVNEMDNPFPTYLISQEDFRFLARDIAFDESPQYDKDTHEQAATLTEQATEVTERLRQVEAQAAAHTAEQNQRLQQAEAENAVLKTQVRVFRYITPLLELVAVVQERYWGDNWDPSDKSSRSTHKQIIDWLIKEKLCSSVKEAEMVSRVASPIGSAPAKSV
jgi:hypothetical protein